MLWVQKETSGISAVTTPTASTISSFLLSSQLKSPVIMYYSLFVTCLASLAWALPQTANTYHPGDIFKRQVNMWPDHVCCEGDCKTELVGNGDPHTDYLHKQVTSPHSCGGGSTDADTCGVSELTSYTIGWSVGGALNTPFLSFDGSVQQSVTTGDTYSCNAGPGETVCVWVNIEHTAYTVQKAVTGDFCDKQPNGPYVIKAPNGHVGYYCVHGSACRNDGDEYWCMTNDGVRQPHLLVHVHSLLT